MCMCICNITSVRLGGAGDIVSVCPADGGSAEGHGDPVPLSFAHH